MKLRTFFTITVLLIIITFSLSALSSVTDKTVTNASAVSGAFSNIGGVLSTDILSDKVPQIFRGIWEGNDRLVFIEQIDDSEKPEIVVIMKDLYGWYYDRVVEPKSYSSRYPLSVNAATTGTAEHVSVDFANINKASLENAGELILHYSKYQKTIVPIAIINDDMYINFYVQDEDNPSYYRGVAVSQGITASQQRVPEEIISYYIDGEDVYKIRYWITDMEYSDRKARLEYDGRAFNVDAHIYSAGHNYACVSGRSNKIRNVFPPEKIDESYVFSDDKTILIKDSQPYMKKLSGKDDFSQLIDIVEKANTRRYPLPSPIFPVPPIEVPQ